MTIPWNYFALRLRKLRAPNRSFLQMCHSTNEKLKMIRPRRARSRTLRRHPIRDASEKYCATCFLRDGHPYNKTLWQPYTVSSRNETSNNIFRRNRKSSVCQCLVPNTIQWKVFRVTIGRPAAIEFKQVKGTAVIPEPLILNVSLMLLSAADVNLDHIVTLW